MDLLDLVFFMGSNCESATVQLFSVFLREFLSTLFMQEFHDSRMSSLMSVLASVPRATQLLDKELNHILLVNSLEQEFRRYLQQVYRHTFQQDKR